MLRDHESSLLANVAQAVGAYAPWASDWPICGFLPVVGWHYDRALMVLGRAPNGWGPGWSAERLRRTVDSEQFAADVQAGGSIPTGGSGPMNWVAQQWGGTDDYNPARSAFWRVIRQVYAGLSNHAAEPEDWSDYLVWSNLYKLAPEDGGNPSETLSRLQFAHALRMFRHEMDTHWPHNVLVLAGWDWASPFIEATCDWWTGSGQVEIVADYNHHGGSRSRIVVAPHPQGRPESDLANAVLREFQKP